MPRRASTAAVIERLGQCIRPTNIAVESDRKESTTLFCRSEYTLPTCDTARQSSGGARTEVRIGVDHHTTGPVVHGNKVNQSRTKQGNAALVHVVDTQRHSVQRSQMQGKQYIQRHATGVNSRGPKEAGSSRGIVVKKSKPDAGG